MMGIRKSLEVCCMVALLSQCCKAQFFPFSRQLSFSSRLGSLGFGEGQNGALQEYSTVNNNQGQGSQTLTSRILGVLANRWDNIEDQIERRLDSLPEHIAERAEPRIEQASDTIERAQEQQQQQQQQQQQNDFNLAGWNNFLSNRWNAFGDDAVENRIEAAEDIIENTYGENAAEAFEDRWDNVEDRYDNINDAIEDRFDDRFDDNNDDRRDDWYDDVFDDRDDDSWNNNANYWNRNNGNSRGYDDDDNWSNINTRYNANNDFWDDFSF